MRLVILDDDLATTEFLASLARRRGWDVGTATHQAKFRELVRTSPADAILLDLQLGESDGIEELRYLSSVNYPGAIVLMSGFEARVLSSAQDIGDTLGLRVVGSIQKPVHEASIGEVLAMAAHEPTDAPATTDTQQPDAVTVLPRDIVRALDQGQMELHLQPIVAANGSGVQRAEALIRWHDPKRGLIPPDAFIPIAESDETVIDRLTMWVAETGASHYQRLARIGCQIQICINISGCNLQSFDFPDRIAALRERMAVPPEALGLEMTETVAMHDLSTTATVLTRLRIKGFSVAIDDFGTGHSSLTVLRRMPFSAIKIDKSFVQDLLTAEDSMTIVRSVIQLAHDMRLLSVAEGVENAAVAQCLTELGIDALQGYYFSRPLPFDDFVDWMKRSHDARAS
jgi:EAL domain-containing protein (putative c-di-GMP-specific phosphodiesterase class I)/ActR/RegA family two-component response regulator